MFRKSICVAVVSVLVVASCTEPIDAGFGSCDLLVDRLAQCGADSPIVGPEPVPRSEKLRYCEKYPIDFKALLSCSVHADCRELQVCLKGARAAQDRKRQRARVGDLIIDLGSAIDLEDWGDADELCQILNLDLDPPSEAVTFCNMLPMRAERSLFNEVEGLRNVPGATRVHLDRCSTLKKWAGRLSAAHETKARRICEEAQLAIDVQSTLEAVRRQLASEDPQLPFACGRHMRALERMETDWSRATAQLLGTSCFTKLAARVLDDYRGCPPKVRRALEAFDHRPEFGVEQADRLARVRVECDR